MPKGGIVTDHLMNGCDIRFQCLKSIVQILPKFELLLCDNTRSILLGAALLGVRDMPPVRSVAVVRDNRFYCVRPQQNRMVSNKVCTECHFACVREDVAPAGQTHRRINMELTRRTRRAALTRYGSVVVTSHELARQVAGIVDDPSRIRRIPNTIGDPEVIRSWIRDVQTGPGDRLLTIGMLNENKGQLAFLRAAMPWLVKRPSVKLVFAGRGERIRSQINDFVDANGLEKQVQLLGFLKRDELFREIARSRLVLAPTVWPEPFGRVPLEAGIAKRAIIAFAVGGLNENIVDGHTGRLVEPGNYPAFLNVLDTLLDDSAERERLAENAEKFIARKFSRENTVIPFLEHVFRSQKPCVNAPD